MSMFGASRLAALLMIVSLVSACGGGGGGGGGGSPNPPQPPSATPNSYLPTDSTLRWTFNNATVAAKFDAALTRNGAVINPFTYAAGGKEYYVTDGDAVYFAGFYSPSV